MLIIAVYRTMYNAVLMWLYVQIVSFCVVCMWYQ